MLPVVLDWIILVAHVVFATLAFGFVILFDFVLVAIARSRDVHAIRAGFAAGFRYARWAGPFLGLAVLIGIGEALRLRISLVSGWLLLTYALVIIAGAIGIGATYRRHGRVIGAAFKSPLEQPSPELEAAIAAERPVGAYLMIVLMVILIYLMFAKPF